MTQEFGTLRRLSARELWKSEPQDFILWLAEEENIAKLGAVLGMNSIEQDFGEGT